VSRGFLVLSQGDFLVKLAGFPCGKKPRTPFPDKSLAKTGLKR
jgi:hypothetical protein